MNASELEALQGQDSGKCLEAFCLELQIQVIMVRHPSMPPLLLVQKCMCKAHTPNLINQEAKKQGGWPWDDEKFSPITDLI
jgi:hypothetical protein